MKKLTTQMSDNTCVARHYRALIALPDASPEHDPDGTSHSP
jgi:hypothetical protein